MGKDWGFSVCTFSFFQIFFLCEAVRVSRGERGRLHGRWCQDGRAGGWKRRGKEMSFMVPGFVL